VRFIAVSLKGKIPFWTFRFNRQRIPFGLDGARIIARNDVTLKGLREIDERFFLGLAGSLKLLEIQFS